MIGPRSRKQSKQYGLYLRRADPKVCAFCGVKPEDARFVEQTANFQVIKNDFPYSLWDAQGVTSHLMVIPIRHTDNLGKMTNQEKVEYVDILEKYEDRGYSIYARAPSSAVKTIFHQHTHLIKTDGFIKSFFFMIKKPFVRIVK